MTRKVVSPDFHRSGVSKSKGGKISYPRSRRVGRQSYLKMKKSVLSRLHVFEAVQLKKISKNVEAKMSIASLKIALFVFDFSPFFGSGGF